MQSDIKLPAGWVFQDKVPARPWVDFGYWRVGNLPFKNDPNLWWKITETRGAGKMIGAMSLDCDSVLYVMCRVEDYPAESPDDWVPQRSVPARPGIDQRQYASKDGMRVGVWEDCGVMAWNRPIMFGDVINGLVVELRCLRKDHPDYQQKVASEPQTFRIGDTVRFRGGMITFLVAWVAKDGMVRLADQSNPAYWCNPAVLELVSRSEGVIAQ